MPGSYRFGRFEMRPTERRLLADGEAVALGARAFDLLLTLVERRERVVARRELLDIVWSGLVVDANNMAVQVSTLRKLLGVHAIATVPGRGYRFAVPLDDEPIAPPSEQVSSWATVIALETSRLFR